jgi:hypothetical protein
LDVDELECVEAEGSVHELYRPLLGFVAGPEPEDDDEDVLEVNAPPDAESPCMDERRVMISRKVGRMVGS